MKTKYRLPLLYAIAAAASAITILLIYHPHPGEKTKQGFDTTIPEGRSEQIAAPKEAYASADTTVTDTTAVDSTRTAIAASIKKMRSTIENFRRPMDQILEPEPAASPASAHTPSAHPQGVCDASVHVQKHTEYALPTPSAHVEAADPVNIRTAEDTVIRRSFSGEERRQGSIRACIHQDQKVTDGSRVRIRLTEDGVLEGIALKSGTILTGTAEMTPGRIRITITSVRTPEGIRQTDIAVYDNDAQEGIYCPQSAPEKAVRNTGSSLVQRMTSTLTGSTAVTALADGTASYVSERIGHRQVKLTADYRITLQSR